VLISVELRPPRSHQHVTRSPHCRLRAASPMLSAMTLTLCRKCARLTDLQPNLPCPTCAGPAAVRHEELDTLDIAHIDCDAFYASVEKRDNPDLADQPVIVGHAGGRGVVTTACYIARRFGPRSAMPMFKALQLCPHAVVIQPDMAKYKVVSQAIRTIFLSVSDCIEPVSLDEAYLDLTAEHHLGAGLPAQSLVQAQVRIEREIGITVSVGLSYNKFLAKLASELQKPQGFSAIGRAEARDFLAGLPVGKINGVGAATAERMAAQGFELISDLQSLTERDMTARFGKFGDRLFQFVHGADPRRVTPDRATKSVSAENTFRRDTARLDDLLTELRDLSEQVERRLKRSALAGRCVVLKLKTHDFKTLTRHAQLQTPTQRADLIYASAEGLLRKVADGRAFRLIGVGVAEITEAATADPPDLFSR
jgi:DNA polymerase IV